MHVSQIFASGTPRPSAPSDAKRERETKEEQVARARGEDDASKAPGPIAQTPPASPPLPPPQAPLGLASIGQTQGLSVSKSNPAPLGTPSSVPMEGGAPSAPESRPVSQRAAEAPVDASTAGPRLSLAPPLPLSHDVRDSGSPTSRGTFSLVPFEASSPSAVTTSAASTPPTPGAVPQDMALGPVDPFFRWPSGPHHGRLPIETLGPGDLLDTGLEIATPHAPGETSTGLLVPSTTGPGEKPLVTGNVVGSMRPPSSTVASASASSPGSTSDELEGFSLPSTLKAELLNSAQSPLILGGGATMMDSTAVAARISKSLGVVAGEGDGAAALQDAQKMLSKYTNIAEDLELYGSTNISPTPELDVARGIVSDWRRGEQVLMPAWSKTHAMYLQLDPKTETLHLYNSGSGVERFHDRDPNDPSKVDTSYVIKLDKKLEANDLADLLKLREKGDVDDIYTWMDKMGAKVAPENPVFQSPQKSDNCVIKGLWAFVRQQPGIDKTLYKEAKYAYLKDLHQEVSPQISAYKEKAEKWKEDADRLAQEAHATGDLAAEEHWVAVASDAYTKTLHALIDYVQPLNALERRMNRVRASIDDLGAAPDDDLPQPEAPLAEATDPTSSEEGVIAHASEVAAASDAQAAAKLVDDLKLQPLALAPKAVALGDVSANKDTLRVTGYLSSLAYLSDPAEIDAGAKALGFDGAKVVQSGFDLSTATGVPFVGRDFNQAVIAYGKDGIVVAFRGTDGLANLAEDFAFSHQGAEGGEVHQGFWDSYTRLRDDIDVELTSLMAWGGYPPSVTWTGHSMGGAMATLAAKDHADRGLQDTVGVVTFGGARAGNEAWARAYDAQLGQITIPVVAKDDLIPKTPPEWLGYKSVAQENQILFDSSGKYTLGDPLGWWTLNDGLSAHPMSNYFGFVRDLFPEG